MNEFIERHYIENKTQYMKRLWYATKDMSKSEDVLHEAYCRALMYFPALEGEEFDKWFSVVLRNATRDFFREEKKREFEELDEFDYEGNSCEGWTNKIIQEIEELIDRKPPDHAEILRLHFKYGYSAIDISRITDYTYHKSHKVVYRFREQLKKRYG